MALPVIDMKGTGQNIEHLRKNKGLSVRELSERMGFSGTNAIYKWQHGTALPTLDNLVILGSVFGVNISEIIVIKGVEK